MWALKEHHHLSFLPHRPLLRLLAPLPRPSILLPSGHLQRLPPTDWVRTRELGCKSWKQGGSASKALGLELLGPFPSLPALPLFHSGSPQEYSGGAPHLCWREPGLTSKVVDLREGLLHCSSRQFKFTAVQLYRPLSYPLVSPNFRTQKDRIICLWPF